MYSSILFMFTGVQLLMLISNIANFSKNIVFLPQSSEVIFTLNFSVHYTIVIVDKPSHSA